MSDEPECVCRGRVNGRSYRNSLGVALADLDAARAALARVRPEALRELSEAATPGPWKASAPEVWRGKSIVSQDYDGCGEGHSFVLAEATGMRQPANAAFIAAAVNHVRDLLVSERTTDEP